MTYSPKKLSIALIVALVVNVSLPYLMQGVFQAEAAPLTEASIRLTRMSAGVVASSTNPILVVFKPANTIASGASPKVEIDWPTSSAFTVSSTDADHTANTTCVPATYQGESVDTLTVTSPGAETAGTVTFDVGEDLNSGTLYGFCLTGGITNPATGNAGTHVVNIATLANTTPTDELDVAVDVTQTGLDQVTLYATVSATFNFALSANVIDMEALSPSAVAHGQITADVDTNANNGWIAWIRSEGGTDALASASSGDSVESTDTSACVQATVGSEQYVVDVNAAAGSGGGGALTVATEYNCTDDTHGGVIATAYEQIAQRTGPVDSDTLTIETNVSISATTEAATDYTDTWQLTAAGNF